MPTMERNLNRNRRDSEATEGRERPGGRGSRGNSSGGHDHRTAKVIEIVCSSTKSFDDAIRKGLQDASATTRGITGCHVENMSIRCEDGEICDYRVSLKIAFGVERTPAP